MDPRIQIVGTAIYGEDLEPMITENAVDVLLLDISVPNSPADHNPYPILHFIPLLLQKFTNLNILVISMFTKNSLIDALVNTRISLEIQKKQGQGEAGDVGGSALHEYPDAPVGYRPDTRRGCVTTRNPRSPG